MNQFRTARRDLLASAVVSAVIVLLALLPYLRNPEVVRVNMHYRVQLLLVATLAMPAIEVLGMWKFRSTALFMSCAALVTWIVNTAAIFVVVTLCRLTIRGTNMIIAKLKPYLC